MWTTYQTMLGVYIQSIKMMVAPDPSGKQLQALLVHAMESVLNGMLITDRTGHIIWANEAIRKMSGYSKAETLGKTARLFSSGKHGIEFYQVLWETILSGNPWQGEITERHRNGSLYTVNQTITPLLDKKGDITHFIACQNKVCMPDYEEQTIHRLAYYDDLTSLPNRRLFFDLLNHAIDHARFEHHNLALMFIDLDHFKSINDTLGHTGGDQLLVAVAERLRLSIRKMDAVARLGGDEFVVLISTLDDPAIAGELAQKIITKISQSYMLEAGRAEIGASIGISLFPHDCESAELLLHYADAAMYCAKESGRNCYRYFNPNSICRFPAA